MTGGVHQSTGSCPPTAPCRCTRPRYPARVTQHNDNVIHSPPLAARGCALGVTRYNAMRLMRQVGLNVCVPQCHGPSRSDEIEVGDCSVLCATCQVGCDPRGHARRAELPGKFHPTPYRRGHIRALHTLSWGSTIYRIIRFYHPALWGGL